MLLNFRVDGLRQTRFREAKHFRPFQPKKVLQLRRRVALNDRVMHKIGKHFFSALLREVGRDQHEMQPALAAAQRFAPGDEDASTEREGEQPLHLPGRTWGLHRAGFVKYISVSAQDNTAAPLGTGEFAEGCIHATLMGPVRRFSPNSISLRQLWDGLSTPNLSGKPRYFTGAWRIAVYEAWGRLRRSSCYFGR